MDESTIEPSVYTARYWFIHHREMVEDIASECGVTTDKVCQTLESLSAPQPSILLKRHCSEAVSRWCDNQDAN